LHAIAATDLPWSSFAGATFVVSGAAGFLPAYMVETLLYLNESNPGLAIRTIGLVRNLERALDRFKAYEGRNDLQLIRHDITQPLPPLGHVDYVIHAASQASPKYYGVDPVGTLSANVLGTHHLLTLAGASQSKAFLFFSTAEVYGQPDPQHIPTREIDYGTVDPTSVRSCYAESKRMGETMCVAWQQQYGVPVKIVRPFHTYGPGMRLDDGRVFADFVADVVYGRPIVVKGDGAARRAFCYLADAVQGFFTVLMRGELAHAYNIGNDRGECSIAELANLLVRLFPQRKLSVTQQRREANKGYIASTFNRSCPDITRARSLGWNPITDLAEGFRRTVRSYE
jgi:nucleoside-diphosphate-sugar epimerase